MTTIDFITTLFCRVDDQMRAVPKHTQALLYPSEWVTIGILYALKGCGERAFYRWLTRDDRPLFPRLPEQALVSCPDGAPGVDRLLLGRAEFVGRSRLVRC